MRVIHRIAAVAVVLSALALAGSSPALAKRHTGLIVLPPQAHVTKLAPGQLLGQGWMQLLRTPVDENPLAGNGDPCMRLYGVVLSPVFLPEMPTTCTARVGEPIFLVGWTSECSNVEEPPYFGADAAAQRACAIAADAELTSVTLTIDGKRTLELRSPRFEVLSRQRRVQLPEDTILGVPAQPATFVAHGYAAWLIPKRPGRYEIVVDVVGGPAPGPATLVLDVARA